MKETLNSIFFKMLNCFLGLKQEINKLKQEVDQLKHKNYKQEIKINNWELNCGKWKLGSMFFILLSN